MHTFVSRKGSVYRVCVDVRLSQKCARRGGFLVIRPESVGGDIGATSQIGPVSPDSRFRDGLHSSAIAVSRDLRHLSRPSTEEWPVIWSLQLRSVLSETKGMVRVSNSLLVALSLTLLGPLSVSAQGIEARFSTDGKLPRRGTSIRNSYRQEQNQRNELA